MRFEIISAMSGIEEYIYINIYRGRHGTNMLIKNINEKQTGFASSLYLEIFVKPMDV